MFPRSFVRCDWESLNGFPLLDLTGSFHTALLFIGNKITQNLHLVAQSRGGRRSWSLAQPETQARNSWQRQRPNMQRIGPPMAAFSSSETSL
jgi:hypothetical protein